MASKKIVYAWDAAVWIAWLTGEEDKDLRGLSLIVEELVAGEATLLLSEIADVEVLDLNPDDNTFETYGLLKKQPYVASINVHPQVIAKAQAIRSRLQMENLSREARKLPVPKATDSIHLATAVLAGATALHTFDKKLLNLNGHAVMEGVPVVRPQTVSGQMSLFHGDDVPVSLGEMTPEDALRKALGTKLPESVIKAEEAAERDEMKSREKN